MPIPPIVHQTWRAADIPKGLRGAVSSWRTMQPSWDYVFHSDSDNLKLLRTRYPWLLQIFSRMTPIQKADVARYAYMHAYGGVYADLDVELLQPLRPLLDRLQSHRNVTVIIGQEPLAHSVLLESKRRQACNAVLASVPGHPFWLAVLQHIGKQNRAGFDPVDSTGPRMLERFITSSWKGAGVHVAAPDVFFPTWDPMQAQTFRRRCRTIFSHGRVLSSAHAQSTARSSIAFAAAFVNALRRRSSIPRLTVPSPIPTTCGRTHGYQERRRLVCAILIDCRRSSIFSRKFLSDDENDADAYDGLFPPPARFRRRRGPQGTAGGRSR